MDDFYLKVVQSFNTEGVKYLVVGGFAVNFHGYNRSTADLDLWVSNEEDNLDRIHRAIETVGFEFDEDASEELRSDRMVSFSDSNSVVELMTRLNISEEVGFELAYQSAVSKTVEGVEMKVISFHDLKREKAKSKRYKDLDDLSKLEEAEAFYARKSGKE
ncbi:nucleotidyltransferase [Roseivirga sp.]|uniref:nucleotidyltransferase n=1 Tax=Roseivirga sp. TaxID=1964215 RepID=UPI003B523FC2